MDIKLYTGFQKRNNSTKVPDSNDVYITLTGNLREPCSIMNPVIAIKRLTSDIVPYPYNYAYVPAFGRYYFIKNWSWREGLWECEMEVDVLASFKSQIGNSSAYVARSASDFNGEITDRMYPATTDFVTGGVNMYSSYYGVYPPSSGCYVLGVIGNANFSTSQFGGAVTYYALTSSQMESLMHYLLSTGFLTDAGFPATMTTAQQLAQDTAKALINPMQYIASCIWYPVSYSTIASSTASTIVLGYWDLDSNHARGYKVDAVTFQEHVYGQLPAHPQSATRGSYLNHAPYTRLTLNVPPFGSIPIDLSYLNAGDYIHGDIRVDVVTGKAHMRITRSDSSSISPNSPVITEASAMFGIPIQISQITPDYLGAITSALHTAANVDSMFNAGKGGQMISDTATGIGDALSSLMPQARITGIDGSMTQASVSPKMSLQYFNIVDEDNTEFGRPLCEVKVINTLSGYIKCHDTHVNYACMENEKTLITNHMLNGFFWE